ncbi:hypothetical protein [Roseovarius indicus]|uniref:Uncharacterized protein n=1 Tax=Roseovarius indicus TaxID=540747 RepID=A0A0T5PAP0_9RHOB|nr:hypothetical protein [Roseovarius indicus]KRS18240.1 hypothetical protein XM52_08820 [Roseovarius indicus]QEW26927.1 hypothetical protein RIdsm_02735 [Roseovarius indicus]SFD57678.1 hypothetical protein SAMN04488031_101609 [Roseovarius indicus]
MTCLQTEAFNETNHQLHLTTSLIDAAYDMAMECRAIDHSDQEAIEMMAILEVAREKARTAMQLHEAEGKMSRNNSEQDA